MKFNTKILHGKAGRNTPDGGTLPGISQVVHFLTIPQNISKKYLEIKHLDLLIHESVIRLSQHLNRESMN